MIQILAQAPPGQAPPPAHTPRNGAGKHGGFAAALSAAGAEPRDRATPTTGREDVRTPSSDPSEQTAQVDQADYADTADANALASPADWPDRTAEASSVVDSGTAASGNTMDATLASLMLAMGMQPVVTPDATPVTGPSFGTPVAGADVVPVAEMADGHGADAASTIVRAAMRVAGEEQAAARTQSQATVAQAAVAADGAGTAPSVGEAVRAAAASQTGLDRSADAGRRAQSASAAAASMAANPALTAPAGVTDASEKADTEPRAATPVPSTADGAASRDTRGVRESAMRMSATERSVREGADGTSASNALDQTQTPAQAQAQAHAAAPTHVPSEGVAHAATVDTTDRAQLAAKLADTVQSAVLRGDHEVHIRLDPPSLGRIDVRIADTPDGLRVTFHATTREAHDLISEQMGTLRTGLEARDLRLDRVDVHHSGMTAGSDRQPFGGWLGRQQDGQRDRQGGTDRQPAWSPLAGMNDRARGANAVARSARPMVQSGSGRVDMLA